MLRRKVLPVLLVGAVLLLPALAQADIIVDKLCKDAPAPAERIYSSFILKYSAGYGDDPYFDDNYLALTGSGSPSGLKYYAGAGYHFDTLEVSFVHEGHCAFALYDAQNVQVTNLTQTYDNGGYWKWYTITADSEGYDFSEVFLKVYSPAAEWGGLGTVQLDRQPVPEPTTVALLGAGMVTFICRKRRTA